MTSLWSAVRDLAVARGCNQGGIPSANAQAWGTIQLQLRRLDHEVACPTPRWPSLGSHDCIGRAPLGVAVCVGLPSLPCGLAALGLVVCPPLTPLLLHWSFIHPSWARDHGRLRGGPLGLFCGNGSMACFEEARPSFHRACAVSRSSWASLGALDRYLGFLRARHNTCDHCGPRCIVVGASAAFGQLIPSA